MNMTEIRGISCFRNMILLKKALSLSNPKRSDDQPARR